MDPTQFCRVVWNNPSEIHIIELTGWLQQADVNLRMRSDTENTISICIPKLTPKDEWCAEASNGRLRITQANTPMLAPKDPINLLPVVIYLPSATLHMRRMLIEVGTCR